MIDLGILGCSEIAYRRFMPEVKLVSDINVKVIAEEYDKSKLEPFCSEYNLEAEESFDKLLERTDIDAVYIPQPPALHYKWAKKALESGKHVLIEKPSTTSYADTKELVELAKEKGLALHENYMFRYHSQIKEIKKMIENGAVGEVRLFRANFGFPLRQSNDFRYNRELGGGALLDAAGYTVKLATLFLGDTTKVDSAHLQDIEGYSVDMYGDAVLSNDEGMVCQIAFGMDCYYQCSLEVWGSKGRLFTNRIFTAPPNYTPEVIIETADGVQNIKLDADTHFKHSIEAFYQEISDAEKRDRMYKDIELQAKLIEEIQDLSK